MTTQQNILKGLPCSLSVLALALILLLVACGTPAQSITTTTNEPAITASQAVPSGVADDYITAASIRDLAQRSTAVVIGRVTAIGGTFNMARDQNDVTKPDPSVLVIGQIYQFQVQRYLKGTGDKTIYVVQPEGFLGPHADKTDAMIATARADDKHIRMRSTVDFLLFLQLHPFVSDPGVSNHQYYVGVAEPWRFDLSDPKRVRPESPWQQASQIFPAISATAIVDQVLNPALTPASTALPTSYP